MGSVIVVGASSRESDAAIARWFKQWLEREQPGTVWKVQA